MGTFWQPHPNQNHPTSSGGFGFDLRISAAATRAPAASMEDSHLQAILEFHRPSSLLVWITKPTMDSRFTWMDHKNMPVQNNMAHVIHIIHTRANLQIILSQQWACLFDKCIWCYFEIGKHHLLLLLDLSWLNLTTFFCTFFSLFSTIFADIIQLPLFS